MDDQVITSRKLYDECQLRVTNLDDTMAGLESDELICRKKIDGLLADTSDDGKISYQMSSENLQSIRSKMQHVRQSKGVAYRAMLEALDNYNDDLAARTIKRKAALRTQLQSERNTAISELAQAASRVVTILSILDGMPAGAISLDKVVRGFDHDFALTAQDEATHILNKLETD